MLIYGKNSILYYIKNFPDDIKEVFIERGKTASDIKIKIPSSIKVSFHPWDYFIKNIPAGNHQGFVAEVNEYQYKDVKAINSEQYPFLVILDGVQDPANLGAILRSAEAFGIDGVIIPKDRACPVTPAVIKASSGAARGVELFKVTNLGRTIEDLKKRGYWIYSIENREDSEDLVDFQMSAPLVFILGSEGKGIRKLQRNKSDGSIKIEQKGNVDSLNVSVTAGVLFYEISRATHKQNNS